MPGPGERVGFAAHIRPLFRARDRASMRFAFDLCSYDEVKDQADAIVGRVRDGTMPCDGAWGRDKVAVFQLWIDEGKQA